MQDASIVLWRVSFDTDYPHTRTYTARVPKSTMPGEDKETPRICFCASIEECLSAMPGDRRFMRGGEKLLAFPFVVSRSDPYLISPETLIEAELVPDASFTGEYWYTAPDPITLEGELYEVKDFEASSWLFATEKDRDAVYEALYSKGVPTELIRELDKSKVDIIVNDILNNDERFWEYDDILGDEVASMVGIPNGVTFDFLVLNPVKTESGCT